MTVLGSKPAAADADSDRPFGLPVRQFANVFASTKFRWLLHAGWVLGLTAWAVARVGRFGFHPTDQGFVLGQSWRLLHGEIPHRDLISARPLGSAALHVVDFLLPGPLFLMST